ncbi:MAG: TPM domain-containing protein, partial [Actinomycetes bacterium]
MSRLARSIAVLSVLAAPVLVAGPAFAEQPGDLTRELTDTAGVLGNDTAEAQAAIDSVESETDTELYVVFVDSFDGKDGQSWADATAAASGLGPHDAVFAVAVDDGLYGLSVGNAVPESDSEIDSLLSSDVEPELSAGDWTGAVVALADGLGGNPASASDDGSGGAGALGVLATIALVGGGGYAILRSRRRRKQAEQHEIAAARAADPFPDETTEQLTFRTSQALLDLDEAIRTSQLELDFARAQYGEEQVAGFAEALAQSQAELQQAFTLRQQLDDEIPEDEATQRRMLADALRLTESADARLDAQAAAFDQLRDLEKTAPQALDRLAPEIDRLQARLPEEERRLAALRERWADSALAPV